jgi:hypothetical protein
MAASRPGRAPREVGQIDAGTGAGADRCHQENKALADIADHALLSGTSGVQVEVAENCLQWRLARRWFSLRRAADTPGRYGRWSSIEIAPRV